MDLKNQIQATLVEIERLVTEMTNVSQMIGASFGMAYRKCGKPGCRCSTDESKRHPVIRITFTENQKSQTRAIPKKDEQRVKELTDNYKNFRQNFQQVRICQNKLNDLLNQFEKITKEKTKMIEDIL